MKRYNKQQVMKDAHRLFNNNFQRKGRSWAECLKAAWRWERDAVKVREEKAAKLDAMITASWKAHNDIKETKNHEIWSQGINTEALSYAMGYGRGNSFYCGD